MVELAALGIQSDDCGSLHAPFPGLIFSVVVDVELVQEGLDITLFTDVHKATLEVLGEVHLLVSVSLAWWISASPTA